VSTQLHAVPATTAAYEPTPVTSRRLRIITVLPIVLFLPSLISFFTTKAGTIWPEYPGIFFHLAILPVVANLRAPRWVQSAGYGWVAIDVLAGVLAINGLPYDTYWPIRMGGHVLAGTWLIGTSVVSSAWAIRVVGVVTGLDLGGYSLVGNVLPMAYVYPGGVLIVIWLTLLAVNAPSIAAATGSRPAQE